MEFLCIFAVLLSIVAAHPDARRPWQGARPQSDEDYEGSQDMGPPMPNPPNGGGPFAGGPGWPEWESNDEGRHTWPGKLPPWYPNRPSRRPGHGGSHTTTERGPVSYPQPTGSPPTIDRGDKSGAGVRQLAMEAATLATTLPTQTSADLGPGVTETTISQRPSRGHWETFGPRGNGRPQKTHHSGKPGRVPLPGPGRMDRDLLEGIFMGGKTLNPDQLEKQKFIPIFKVDNVSFENVTGLHLKEGENIYLLPKAEKRPPMPKELNMNGLPEPQGMYGMPYQSQPRPYFKIVYNPTATNKVSVEYGIFVPL